MKISINTSSFSFCFIGICFIIMAIFTFLFWSKIIGLVILIISIYLITKKYRYLIPKKSKLVLEQIEKTLKLLNISYEKTHTGFSNKVIRIKVRNYILFTILQFKFQKVYTVQGKYLTETIIKYQRYI